jgi:hypothetical protein
MAQAVTRCRLTGHYMFMGLDVDPTPSSGPFERKFCPFYACDHLWPQGRLQIPGAEVAVASRHSASGAERRHRPAFRRRLAPTIFHRTRRRDFALACIQLQFGRLPPLALRG